MNFSIVSSTLARSIPVDFEISFTMSAFVIVIIFEVWLTNQNNGAPEAGRFSGANIVIFFVTAEFRAKFFRIKFTPRLSEQALAI